MMRNAVFPGLFSNNINKILPTLILGVLAVTSFSVQGLGFYRSIQTTPAVTPAMNPSVSEDEQPSMPSAAAQALFGASMGENERMTDAPLPESNLNLQVSAIFFTTPHELSTVVLEDGDKTVTLKRDEEVRKGVIIKNIESHRVTLERNGKLEQITFRGFSEGRDSSPVQTAQAPRIANAAPAQIMKKAPTPASVRKPSQQRTSTAYQKFMQRKQAQHNN